MKILQPQFRDVIATIVCIEYLHYRKIVVKVEYQYLLFNVTCLILASEVKLTLKKGIFIYLKSIIWVGRTEMHVWVSPIWIPSLWGAFDREQFSSTHVMNFFTFSLNVSLKLNRECSQYISFRFCSCTAC